MSGGKDVWDDYDTVRLYYRGRPYDIPVDEDGYVPVDAMVIRYQEMGNSSNDRNRDSRIIYPSRACPKDILRWWVDPSSSDVEGIDTSRSRVYDVSGIRGKRMRQVQRRIGVVTPSPKEQQRIRRILANAFTVDELERMARGKSVVIRTMKDGGDIVGYYLRRSDGQQVPIITLEEGCTPDHVVHEAVHHLRTTRPPGKVTSSAFPEKRDGSLDTARYSRMSDARRREVHDAEETATTVEAAARTKVDPDPSGYWDYAGGRLAYIRDKARLSEDCGGGDCTLKGAAAVKAVERKFDRLDMAMASVLADKPAKDSVRDVQKANAKSASKGSDGKGGKQSGKTAATKSSVSKGTAKKQTGSGSGGSK